jgi:hypothetical protein
MEEIWQISGLSVGRFLTLNIREQAKESRAFAARPYTVSVGMATGLDIFNVSIAFESCAESDAWIVIVVRSVNTEFIPRV